MKSAWRPKWGKSWRAFLPQFRRLQSAVERNLNKLGDDELPGFSDLVLQVNAEARKNAYAEVDLELKVMHLHDAKLAEHRRDSEQAANAPSQEAFLEYLESAASRLRETLGLPPADVGDQAPVMEAADVPPEALSSSEGDVPALATDTTTGLKMLTSAAPESGSLSN